MKGAILAYLKFNPILGGVCCFRGGGLGGWGATKFRIKVEKLDSDNTHHNIQVQ